MLANGVDGSDMSQQQVFLLHLAFDVLGIQAQNLNGKKSQRGSRDKKGERREKKMNGNAVVVPDSVRQSMFQELAAAHRSYKRKREGLDKEAPESADDVGIELAVSPRRRDPDDAARSLIQRPDIRARIERIEETTTRAANDHFDPVAFEAHLKERGVLRNDWIVHERRASMDPFYALWYCPTATITTFDVNTQQQTTMLFVDKVVRDCMEFYELRGGDEIAKNKQIQIAFDHLRSTSNSRIKLFAICFFMTWSDQIRDHLASLYTDRGFRKRVDFMRVSKVLKEMCELVWRASSVSRYNINQVVTDVLRAGISAYIRPPGFASTAVAKK